MRDLLSDAPRRSPRYLLGLIEWLPADGALSACLQAEPRVGKAKPPSGPHAFYGRGPLWHVLTDLWDLQAAVGMAGSKKKPPTYPRDPVKPKSMGIPLRSLIPKRHPINPPPVQPAQPGPRVAGRRKKQA